MGKCTYVIMLCQWVCSASTSSITCRAPAALAGLVSRNSTRMIRAFHSAQPRTRAQVSWSTNRSVWKNFLLGPEKRVQAIVRSKAGSPAASWLMSITAQVCPIWELLSDKHPNQFLVDLYWLLHTRLCHDLLLSSEPVGTGRV